MIASFLATDKERRMEDQWVKWLRKDFQKTVNYLELLFYNLAGFESFDKLRTSSDAEMESVLDWAEDPDNPLPPLVRGTESYKPKFVQSWNDDSSEDDWDELDDDVERW
jgi:hypothetical protein